MPRESERENMNYIAEINGFEQWLESNFLPASSQLLWYKMIALCNRCGWAEWIVVDNLRLMLMVGATSQKTALTARDKLIESGFLEMKKGKKGSPNQYHLKSIQCQKQCKNYTKNDTKNDTKKGTINAEKREVQTAHINKHKLKRNEKEIDNSSSRFKLVIEDFEKYINASPSPAAYQILKSYVDDGIEPELICQAIYKANDEGKRSISYIKGILNSCLANGIKTKEAFLIDVQSRDSRKQSTNESDPFGFLEE